MAAAKLATLTLSAMDFDQVGCGQIWPQNHWSGATALPVEYRINMMLISKTYKDMPMGRAYSKWLKLTAQLRISITQQDLLAFSSLPILRISIVSFAIQYELSNRRT